MKRQSLLKIILMGLLALGVCTGPYAWANDSSETPKHASSEKQGEGTTSVESDVATKEQEEVATKRKALVKEALAALAESKKALKALEDNRPKDALTALAEVTGQLEIIISRDPKLAFVPIDVQVTSSDIYADLESIKLARNRAEELLEDGQVQKARVQLSGLASEMVIRTISLPLATYPDAIKAVVPLIDAGKIEEAKTALQDALQTFVVTNKQIIPLPILRAEALVKKAEKLAKKMETPELKDAKNAVETSDSEKMHEEISQKDQILEDLQKARHQLQMAEALGYGLEEDRYQEFQKNIETIEKKVRGKESTQGVFASLQHSLSEFKQFLFDE